MSWERARSLLGTSSQCFSHIPHSQLGMSSHSNWLKIRPLETLIKVWEINEENERISVTKICFIFILRYMTRILPTSELKSKMIENSEEEKFLWAHTHNHCKNDNKKRNWKFHNNRLVSTIFRYLSQIYYTFFLCKTGFFAIRIDSLIGNALF